MFRNVSMTGVGMATYILSTILSYYGVVADTAEISGFVNALANTIGFILMIVGQLGRNDLKGGLLRK